MLCIGGLLTFCTTANLFAQCQTKTRVVTECNNNGTPCDPSDDFHDVSGYMFHMGGDQWTAEINGVIYGPFAHTHALEYFGEFPANGAPLCVKFQDTGDPACMKTVCTDPLLPCPTMIDITYLEYECNDNGTANDPTDDYYIIKVRVQFTDFLPDYNYGYMLEIDGEIYGPYRYGNLATIEVPANGLLTKITAYDENDPTCMDMENIGPLTPCSVPCTMLPQVIKTECFDNGTPNPRDDFYKITVLATAAVAGPLGTYFIESDQLPNFQYRYGETFTLVLPARGDEITLTFTDTHYEDCFEEVTIGPLEPCSTPCDLEVDSISYICFDNNTPDPTDDYYEVVLNVTATGAGSGYTAFINGNLTGPWAYDSIITFTIPADGLEHNIIIKDVDFPSDCKTSALIGPLEPCSAPCVLTFDEQSLDCFDNLTADTLDDYYVLTLQISEPGHKPGDQYNLTIGVDSYGPYDYGELVMINLPADGSTRMVLIQDTRRGVHCELSFEIGPLIPCSSACELDLEISNVQCQNAGTGLDPSDDTFTFDITVNGVDVGATWQADDAANTTGAYGETKSFGPYLISGGPISLNVFDVTDIYCRENILVSPPPPCSDSCVIDLVDLIIGDCDDNNTGKDSLDDTFMVDLFVAGQNFGSGYSVEWNGTIWGPFNYNQFIQVGPLPANGQNLTLIISDSDIDYCEITVDVSQDPCSECLESGDAGLDQTLNCSISEVELRASATASGIFSWTGPGNLQFSGPNPKVRTPGWYTLEITFENGCTVIDSVQVLRDTAQPVASPLTPGILTCKDEEVMLEAGASSTGLEMTYYWTNEQGDTIGTQQDIMVNLPGIYCLEVRDTIKDCGSGLSCVEVQEDKTPPTVIILVDPDSVLNCRIDSVRLSSLASPNTSHIWTFHANNYMFDTLWVKDTGMVYITVTDTMNGCTTTEEILIESLLEYPIVRIEPPPPLTCAVQSVVINANASQSGNTIQYRWFDDNFDVIQGAISRTLTVTEPGTYYFEVVDEANGCTNIDTVEVLENKIFHSIDAGPDDEMRCDSDELALQPSTSAASNLITLRWSVLGQGMIVDDSDPLNPLVGSEGTYVVEIEDKETGCISRDTVVISRAESPDMEAITGNEICLNAEDGWLEVTEIFGGTEPYDLSVNGSPQNTTLIQDLEPGQYTISIVDAKGCTVDTIVQILEGRSFDGNLNGKINVIQGDTTTLSAEVNIDAQEIDQIIWESNGKILCSNCSSIDVNPSEETTYNVQIIDRFGCHITLSITVFVKDDNKIWAPNAFTPDGNKINDFFNVFGKNLVLVEELIIFDRWGEQIYQGFELDPSEGWDGTLNGVQLNPAVFVYYAVGVFRDGTKAEIYGDVTLVR